MGLGGAFLLDLIELKRGGFLAGATKVVEIGAQQLADSFLKSDGLLDEIFGLFGRSRPDLGKPHGNFLMAEDAPSSRLFWTALGFEYAASISTGIATRSRSISIGTVCRRSSPTPSTWS